MVVVEDLLPGASGGVGFTKYVLFTTFEYRISERCYFAVPGPRFDYGAVQRAPIPLQRACRL
jgi:hypothetical protein